MSSITDYLLVFAIGGTICVIGQLLMSLTRLTPARILVIFVTAGVVLTAVGLYKPIVELGGAGATVPLTGFGYSLANGAIDGAMNEGLLGAITGGVKATAGGIAAAVLFGYAFALIFTPKTKSKHSESKHNRLPTDDGSRLCIVNV